MESPVEILEKRVIETFALGYERMYVETGKYKGCMPNTVKALGRRGYRVEKAARSAFYVYPKVQSGE